MRCVQTKSPVAHCSHPTYVSDCAGIGTVAHPNSPIASAQCRADRARSAIAAFMDYGFPDRGAAPVRFCICSIVWSVLSMSLAIAATLPCMSSMSCCIARSFIVA